MSATNTRQEETTETPKWPLLVSNEPQWIWPRTMTHATISKAPAENLELYQQKYPRKLLMADISVQGDYFSQPVLTFFRFLCRTYIMNHTGDTT